MGVTALAKAHKEETWQNFVCISKSNLIVNEQLKNALTDFDISEDLATVLLYRLGDFAVEWLNNPVPALDNRKPIDLIKSEKGYRAVKEALLRMPD